jgi:hypothetical protein
MDASVGAATEPDFGEAAAGRLTDHRAGESAAIASCDQVTMGVGAVMALHSVDQQTATTALRRAADRAHVPVSAVAHAVLTLAAGTDEQLGARAGRAATQLLAEGFIGRARDADDARDRAADRRDDIAAKRDVVLGHREAVVQAIVAAAEERDRLAEERDRRAEGRDQAAERRPFTSQEEYAAAAAADRGRSAIDRFNSGVDRDHSAGDRAELMGLPRGPLRRPSGDPSSTIAKTVTGDV